MTASNGTVSIGLDSSSFINNGVVTANNGTVSINATNWNNASPGVFNVGSGGTLNLGGSFTTANLGVLNRSAGALNITGTFNLGGSTLDVGSAGLFGPGGLSQLSGTLAGGRLISTDATPALASSGSGRLDGITIGSNLSINGSLTILNDLLLANGVTVNKGANSWFFGTTGLRTLGLAPGASSATVTSSGGSILAGFGVSGQTLSIGPGVTLQSSGTGTTTLSNSTTASIINNGTIASTTGGAWNITPTSFTNGATGKLVVATGSTIATANNSFTNNGTIEGSGTINVGTGTITNNGTIKPGASPGLLTITGGLTLGSGSVTEIEISGYSRGQDPGYDGINVSGNLNINAGALVSVQHLNGFSPVLGDNFLIINAGGTISGSFPAVAAAPGSENYASGSVGGAFFLQRSDTTFNNAGLKVWTVDTNGFWNVGPNWVGGVAPVAGDFVFIDRAAANPTVTVNAAGQVAGQLYSNEALVVSSGALTVAGRATLNGAVTVSGGTLTLNGTTTASGGLTLSNGTLTANGPTSTGLLNLSGGTLGGTGTFDVTGLTNWSGGTLTGGGVANFNGGTNISSTSVHDTFKGTLNLFGTTTWTNAAVGNVGQIRIGSGATVVNKGTFLDNTVAATSINANFGGVGTFSNEGTYTKSGAVTTTISSVFNNTATGAVNIGSGTLLVSGGGTSDGSIGGNAGSTLQFSAGTYTLNAPAATTVATLVNGATVNVNGTGAQSVGALTLSGGTVNLNATGGTTLASLDLSGGTLGGTGTFDVTGLTNWSGGTLTGGGVANFNGGTNISSTSVHDTFKGTLNLFGTTTWTNAAVGNVGQIRIGSGATVVNKGTFLDNTVAATSINANFGGVGTFSNEGTYTKSGAVTTTISSVFNNTATGAVNIGAGTLAVAASATTNAGSTDIAAGAQLSTSGLAWTNVGLIQGNGTVNLGTATLTNSGTLKPGATGATGTLFITGNLVNAAGGTIQAEIGGTTAASQYDVLAVSGNVNLAGTLNSPLINGFTPVGQSFDVITAGGSASGSFTTLNLPSGVNSAIVGKVYRLTASGVSCTGVCWDGGGGNTNWNTAANWTGDLLPGINDIAFLNLVAGVTVDHSSGTNSIKGLNSDANNGLIISGGSLTLNDPATTSTLNGPLSLTGGTLTANGALNANNTYTQSGGTLSGADDITLAGPFNWSGGTVTGSGNFITSGTSTLSGASDKFLNNRAWSNQGTVNLSAGNLRVDGNTFTNAVGGVLNVSTNLSGSSVFTSGNAVYSGTGTGTFTNAGTLNWATPNDSAIGLSMTGFNNTGTVNVNGPGKLILNAGGTDSGLYDIAASRSLEFARGTRTLGAGSNVTGAGQVSVTGGIVNGENLFDIASSGAGLTVSNSGRLNLNGNSVTGTLAPVTISGGTLNLNTAAALTLPTLTLSNGGALGGSGNVTVTGPFTWSDGTVTGSGNFITSGTSTLSGASVKFLDNRAWSNQGTVNLSAGILRVDGNTFTNAVGGVLNISTDALSIGHVIFSNSGTGSVTNAGTLNWATPSDSAIGLSMTAFNNTGTVNVNGPGKLTINTALTNTGTLNIANGTISTGNRSFTNSAPGTITSGNSGTLDLGAGNTLTNAGTISPGLPGTAGTLTITGNLALESTSLLEIDLLGSGTTPLASDRLVVNGNVSLGGTLTASLASGYNPPVGTTADILTASSFGGTTSLPSGSFTTTNLPADFSGTIVTPPAPASPTYRLTKTAPVPSCAVGVCWDGDAGDNLWSTATNWSRDTLPGISDTAYLNLSSGASVLFNIDSVSIAALFSEANNSLTIAGGRLVFNDPSLSPSIQGALNVAGGNLVLNNASVDLRDLTLSFGSITGSAAVAVSSNLQQAAGTSISLGSFSATQSTGVMALDGTLASSGPLALLAPAGGLAIGGSLSSNGALLLSGNGASGIDGASGISLRSGSSLTSASLISLTGIGGSDASDAHGVHLMGQVRAGSGLTISGQGGAGLDRNVGVLQDPSSRITVAGGSGLTLSGSAQGSGASNRGVELRGLIDVEGGEGGAGTVVTAIGSPFGSGSGNGGLLLDGATLVNTDGVLSLSGIGGLGTTNLEGVRITGSSISSGAFGPASLEIVGRASAGGVGVDVDANLSVSASLRLRAETGSLNIGGALEGSRILATAATGLNLASETRLTANDPSGVTLQLAAGSGAFSNSAGSAPFSVAAGATWQVYSASPFTPQENLGGLVYDFKQYGKSFADTTPVAGSGNGLFYAFTPILEASLSGSTSKVYDGSLTAVVDPAQVKFSGVLPGDAVSLGATGPAFYDSRDVGSGKLVTLTGVGVLTASEGSIPVYGYQVNQVDGGSAPIGVITPATVFGGFTADNKIFDGSTAATILNRLLSGAVPGDQVALVGGTASFTTPDVGTSKTVLGTGFQLAGADRGNYTLFESGLSTVAAILKPPIPDPPIILPDPPQPPLDPTPPSAPTSSFPPATTSPPPPQPTGQVLPPLLTYPIFGVLQVDPLTELLAGGSPARSASEDGGSRGGGGSPGGAGGATTPPRSANTVRSAAASGRGILNFSSASDLGLIFNGSDFQEPEPAAPGRGSAGATAASAAPPRATSGPSSSAFSSSATSSSASSSSALSSSSSSPDFATALRQGGRAGLDPAGPQEQAGAPKDRLGVELTDPAEAYRNAERKAPAIAEQLGLGKEKEDPVAPSSLSLQEWMQRNAAEVRRGGVKP